MPISDWQFWVVTIIAIAALWMLKIALLPKKKKGTKTTLTVDRKPIDKQHTKHKHDCGCS